MKTNTKTSFRIACLAVLIAALGGWVWWGRSHLPEAIPSASQSPAGSTVGADSQKTVKAIIPLPVSGQAVPTPTPGAEPAAAIPETLQSILNSDGATFKERVRSLHAINRNLMIEEVEALYRYLRAPAKEAANRAGENWLRNDIMDVLVEQPALPQGYPDVLIAIYQDQAQDVVMRDYALQHIPPVYARANAQEKVDLRNILWQATGETDTSIAGTSLLALLEIVGPLPPSGDIAVDSLTPRAGTRPTTDAPAKPVDSARLAQTALKLANDDHCGELSRITAVQICGRMKVDAALPVIEQLAQEAPSMPLRIAATAALGDLGTFAAASLLNRLAESSDPRQALAAQSALRRISRRQMTSAPQTEVHR